MKKIILSCLTLIFGIIFSVSAAMAKPYTDLDQSHWAYKEIQELSNKEVVVGYPDETYKPDSYITRAEYATMVVKALGQDKADIKETIDFTDVPNDNWAWGAVQRGVRFDLVKGAEGGLFRPNDNVTRLECLDIVINSLTTEDLTLSQAKKLVQKGFKDYIAIPDFFIIKAAKGYNLGIIAFAPGEQGFLNAQKPATRAEVAVFLYNMIEQVRLTPNKKLAEVLKPITADGIVLESATVDGNIAVIPAGTVLPLMIRDNINSQTTKIGTPVLITVPKNFVTKEKYLLIPENSSVKGHLLGRDRAIILFRNGKLVVETRVIETKTAQSASFRGISESDPMLSIWRKIFKGLKIDYKDAQIIPVKLLQPLRIDLTNSWIIE